MRIFNVLAFCIIFCAVTFAQTAATSSNPPAEPWGNVRDGRFSSPRLGLTVPIPSDWTLISSAEQELLGAAGTDVLKQGSSNASIDAALNRTIQLLAIAEHPVGTPRNAALEIVAVQQQAGVTAKMSLAANVMLLKGTPFVLKTRRSAVKIGQNLFETADLEGVFSGVQVKQRMYVIIQKGYSMMIAVTYSTGEQLSSMEKVIASVSLSK